MSQKRKPKGAPRDRIRLTIPGASEVIEIPRQLPLLPLRDVVVFPQVTLPLFVGRSRSVAAIEDAICRQKILFATAQCRPEVAQPSEQDLYPVGTIVRILQLFRLPDGTLRILAEGIERARSETMLEKADNLNAIIALEPDETSPEDLCRQLMVSVKRDFSRCVELDRRLVPEVGVAVRGVADPTALSWKVAANVQAGVEVRQRILEECSVLERLRQLRTLLAERLQVLQGQGQSRRRTARDLDSEAMGDDLISGGRAHSRGESLMHLGDFSDELDEIAQAIEAAGMPKTAEEKAFRELERLGKMALMSPEATVCRSYLETLTQIPWRQRTRDRTDLAKVEKILDEDHFGLRKVKERIIELIAVIKLSREVRGPILCLTGPPGVGKTSLGQSIARAIGRRFVRMSLGGMRDESEIRGHRRTYIGSMPGRIIQAMRRAGSINPVILLDEVDKLGSDHRGDPAAALLEVLDPEQNCAFNDHYLQVDYDLSKVLFITTANLLDNIPAPLRDRMEVIRIPGYLENEKIQIARRFLLPRQRKSNGLVEEDLDLPEATLAHMVRAYTREAGVRNLEREIARICRRVAKVKAGGKDRALGKALGQRLGRKPLGITITPEKLKDLLGPTRHEDLTFERSSRVGVATGLAWTSAGGELLNVEVGVFPGRGSLLLTGHLGETMRESAQAALSYIRSRREQLGLDRGFYRRLDIHVHVPEGAVPKDGPSAGVTLALAMVSALTGIPARSRIAMTGEITLRGHVLPVGGLGEKLVAARRAGIHSIILPRGNAKHIEELPRELLEGLTLQGVETMDEVLSLGLESRLDERPQAGESSGATPLAA